MLNYPARIEGDPGSGYVASFRDIPEALTQGDTFEDAKEAARDALITAMEFYFEDRRPVPQPSKAEVFETMVQLPPSVTAKVLLLNAMIENHTRPADLARGLGIRPQEVTRLLDLRHATKIDAIGAALHALGRDLVISAPKC